MHGTRRGIIIQERDRRFLRQLATFRIVDREQAKVIGGFHSTTRVNARLLALTKAELLRRFFLGVREGSRRAVYSLSPKGAALIGAAPHGLRRPKDALLVADFVVVHQLAINDVYVAFRAAGALLDIQLARWISFYEPIAPNLFLIPDAYCELDANGFMMAAFLEADLGHERLKIWTAKVKHYVQFALSGEYSRTFGRDQFRVLVVANSDKRLLSLRNTVASSTQKIFWFATFDAIQSQGPFAPIWIRPHGDEPQSLFPIQLSPV
jgi:hypothetical protein